MSWYDLKSGGAVVSSDPDVAIGTSAPSAQNSGLTKGNYYSEEFSQQFSVYPDANYSIYAIQYTNNGMNHVSNVYTKRITMSDNGTTINVGALNIKY